MAKAIYNRVLIKLSGEALAGEKGNGIDEVVLSKVVDQIIAVHNLGVEVGIVVGGGLTLYNISKAIRREKTTTDDRDILLGINILIDSLEAPMKQIIENTGMKYKTVKKMIDRASQDTVGFDALKGKIVDLKETGIVDSAKVVRCALENASSVAGTILTVNGIVTNDVDEMIRYNSLLK